MKWRKKDKEAIVKVLKYLTSHFCNISLSEKKISAILPAAAFRMMLLTQVAEQLSNLKMFHWKNTNVVQKLRQGSLLVLSLLMERWSCCAGEVGQTRDSRASKIRTNPFALELGPCQSPQRSKNPN